MAAERCQVDENDGPIMDTALDASICKLSASSIGYYKDPFIPFFVKNTPSRRMPLINRGYYARVMAIREIVERYITAYASQQRKVQIVVLGAGFDTLYFRLCVEKGHLVRASKCSYFELDFPEITMQKLRIIRRRAQLQTLLHFESEDELQRSIVGHSGELHTPDSAYHLIPCDLRAWDTTQDQLAQAGLDPSLPTLIVSECVLIYMETAFSEKLIQWAADTLKDAHFVLYEQIEPHDPFGKVMMQNIKARGCVLKSIYAFPSKAAQIERFQAHQFQHVSCLDMNQVYYKFLDPKDRQEKEKLEIFDEVEEFHLLQAHYCIVVASQVDSIGAQSIQLQSPVNQ
uniref:Leucine carboxyl methyltransferase 1 n=1 Tax=Albugo laibachii Nc14 TaxID=890382 RepID=F0WLB9_9STRA|nr:leucine carboxyl methyltransferase putative [Albugo laibachii Nc14]|eukprot:CCA22082.1 leucine carboxyl methyltransferase putative [Albugo laibachii Nc14]